jgi:hypothetical protein
MTLDRWDDSAKVTYDRATWNELCSLRFVESGHNAGIMGPVGVGKTFLATALGHAAVRRRVSVHLERCDRLLKRLRASRLDNSHDVEMRKLLRGDLLIIDDFALQAPTNSCSTASPTGNARSRPSPRPTTNPLTPPPPTIIPTPTLTPRQPVPFHWRTGGPIELAHDREPPDPGHEVGHA